MKIEILAEVEAHDSVILGLMFHLGLDVIKEKVANFHKTVITIPTSSHNRLWDIVKTFLQLIHHKSHFAQNLESDCLDIGHQCKVENNS